MIIVLLIIVIVVTICIVFYNLAKKYGENKFVYTAFGFLAFTLGVVLYVLLARVFWKYLSSISRYTHEYISFLFGILIAVGVHYLLERKWKKYNNVEANEEIEKIGRD